MSDIPGPPADPVYEQGYRDGENSQQTSWEIALREVLPEGVDINPGAVADWLTAVQANSRGHSPNKGEAMSTPLRGRENICPDCDLYVVRKPDGSFYAHKRNVGTYVHPQLEECPNTSTVDWEQRVAAS